MHRRSGRTLLIASAMLLCACGVQAPRGPEQAADTSVRRADHRFIAIGTEGYVGPLGVTCEAPSRRGPSPLHKNTVYVSDVAGDDDPARLHAQLAFAAAYNKTVLDHPLFPYPDVCRAGEDVGRRDPADRLAGAAPARPFSGPARNLADAARRGSSQELRHWLRRTREIDTLDAFGLSALGWAVLRNRPTHVDALIEAGAHPWLANVPDPEQQPLWLAARLGHRELFGRLAAARTRPALWPTSVLDAAADGPNSALLADLLNAPHEQICLEALLDSAQAQTQGVQGLLSRAPDRLPTGIIVCIDEDHPDSLKSQGLIGR